VRGSCTFKSNQNTNDSRRGTLLLSGENYTHAELYTGIERIVRIKTELLRFSVVGVASGNNFEKAVYSIKFGINFLNTFTNKWDY
jgi:hypothetical protein